MQNKHYTIGNFIKILIFVVFVGSVFGIIASLKTSNAESNSNIVLSNKTPIGTDGPIHAIATGFDQAVYIGGEFTLVYTDSERTKSLPRNRVAKILPDGTVDAAWNPNVDGAVEAISVIGSSIYIGGTFKNAGGKSRNNIAAFEAATGKVIDTWNPNANGSIFAFALLEKDGSQTLYAGGAFTNIGGSARNRAAALDVQNGAALAWNPNADGTVNTLTVNARGMALEKIYAGGLFKNIGGKARNNGAELDLTSGNATDWNPNIDGEVKAIAVDSNAIYFGGSFKNAGGQARSNFAVFEKTSGNLSSYTASFNGTVNAIAANDAETFVGGNFTTLNSVQKGPFVALEPAKGSGGNAFALWAANFNSQVRAIVLRGGDNVHIGGDFTMYGSDSRAYYAQTPQTSSELIGGSYGSFNDNSIQFAEASSSGDENIASVSISVVLQSRFSRREGDSFRSRFSEERTRSVVYAVSGGTATVDADYKPVSGTVTFASEATTAAIPLTIIDDVSPEENETIVITLSNPTEAGLGQNTTFIYTIIDNDGRSAGGVPGGGGGSGGSGGSGASGGSSVNIIGGGGGSGGTVPRKVVELSDISKVKGKATLEAIKKIAQLMVDTGTGDFGNKFGPNLKVTPVFAAQLGLAIMGKSCGAPQKRVKGCVELAVKSGLFAGINTKQKFITRGELYAVLLKAANIPLVAKSEITSKNLCKDISAKDANAIIIATARKYKVASLYKGTKCNAKLEVRRSEAALFAARVLTLMKK